MFLFCVFFLLRCPHDLIMQMLFGFTDEEYLTFNTVTGNTLTFGRVSPVFTRGHDDQIPCSRRVG